MGIEYTYRNGQKYVTIQILDKIGLSVTSGLTGSDTFLISFFRTFCTHIFRIGYSCLLQIYNDISFISYSIYWPALQMFFRYSIRKLALNCDFCILI